MLKGREDWLSNFFDIDINVLLVRVLVFPLLQVILYCESGEIKEGESFSFFLPYPAPQQDEGY